MSKNQERRQKNVRLAGRKPSIKLLSVYMDMTSLEESWKVTIGHLEAARKLLPEEMFFEEAKAFDKEYLEYLEHNEL